VALAKRSRIRAWVVAFAAAPAVVAYALWCAPMDRGPFARIPRPGVGPPVDAPTYGLASWRCIYDGECDEIDAISRR
jgi:hypothetical protein